jgi:hypothetical protein
MASVTEAIRRISHLERFQSMRVRGGIAQQTRYIVGDVCLLKAHILKEMPPHQVLKGLPEGLLATKAELRNHDFQYPICSLYFVLGGSALPPITGSVRPHR